MDLDADRLLTGEAWRQWCDRLRAAGERILDSDAGDDDRTRTEGYRKLTRLLRYATELEVEAADPAFPDFVQGGDPHSQWGGPNPDIVCLRAVVDPRQTYKIWADVDGLFQAIFSQHEGDLQLEQHGVYHERHLDSFELDEDGFLEMILSPDEHEMNWMPAHPRTRFFAIRMFASDWENHTVPTFHIERVGAEGLAPPALSAGDLARGLDRAMEWVEKSMAYWSRYSREAFEQAAPNVAEPAENLPGGADDIAMGRCFWDLADDEALLLTCEAPLASYWGFNVQTMTWLEGSDPARRQTSLSGDQIHLDEDGLARIVVSARDPGVPNWIDTHGRRRGLLVYHWVWTETLPMPSAEVIPVERLLDRLPENHPVLSENERREQLSLRREALLNRMH